MTTLSCPAGVTEAGRSITKYLGFNNSPEALVPLTLESSDAARKGEHISLAANYKRRKWDAQEKENIEKMINTLEDRHEEKRQKVSPLPSSTPGQKVTDPSCVNASFPL